MLARRARRAGFPLGSGVGRVGGARWLRPGSSHPHRYPDRPPDTLSVLAAQPFAHRRSLAAPREWLIGRLSSDRSGHSTGAAVRVRFVSVIAGLSCSRAEPHGHGSVPAIDVVGGPAPMSRCGWLDWTWPGHAPALGSAQRTTVEPTWEWRGGSSSRLYVGSYRAGHRARLGSSSTMLLIDRPLRNESVGYHFSAFLRSFLRCST